MTISPKTTPYLKCPQCKSNQIIGISYVREVWTLRYEEDLSIPIFDEFVDSDIRLSAYQCDECKHEWEWDGSLGG